MPSCGQRTRLCLASGEAGSARSCPPACVGPAQSLSTRAPTPSRRSPGPICRELRTAGSRVQAREDSRRISVAETEDVPACAGPTHFGGEARVLAIERTSCRTPKAGGSGGHQGAGDRPQADARRARAKEAATQQGARMLRIFSNSSPRTTTSTTSVPPPPVKQSRQRWSFALRGSEACARCAAELAQPRCERLDASYVQELIRTCTAYFTTTRK